MVPPSAVASGSAHMLTLVKQASTLRREDIEGLAAALLDLASGYESALRTVMSMQRLLERVRRSEEIHSFPTRRSSDLDRKSVV